MIRNLQTPLGQAGYWLNLALCMFALWTYEGAFLAVLRGADFQEVLLVGGSDPLARASNAFLFLTLLMLFICKKDLLLRTMRIVGPALPTIIVAILSTAWSVYPFVTIRRAANMLTCLMFAYYVYDTFSARRFIQLFGWSLLICMVLSLPVAVILPSRAYDVAFAGEPGHALHGVFAQKNQMSVYAALGICTWIYLGFSVQNRDSIEARIRWPAVAVMLICLVLSKGTTSMLALAVAVMLACYFRWGRAWQFRLAGAYLICSTAVLLGSALLLDSSAVFGLAGKDASLTGRLPLWTECFKMINLRPLLGYGYAAFWNADSTPTKYIWQQIGWQAPNAHNGAIELLLDIGYVGLAIYLFMIVAIVRATLRNLKRQNSPEAQWFALFMTVMFIENIDEGTLALPDAAAVIVFFGAALASRWRQEELGLRLDPRPKAPRPEVRRSPAPQM